MKVVNVIRNIAAVIAGYIVLLVTTPLIALVIGFISQIPIIGSLLFYPVETSWAALIAVNLTTVVLGAAAASFIQPEENAWGTKVYGFLTFGICVFVLIASFINGASIWPSVIAGATGLVVALEA